MEEQRHPTEHQQAELAWVAKVDPRLHCGYLLEERIRFVFQIKGYSGKTALDRWLKWAQRCRIPMFVELGRKIRRQGGGSSAESLRIRVAHTVPGEPSQRIFLTWNETLVCRLR